MAVNECNLSKPSVSQPCSILAHTASGYKQSGLLLFRGTSQDFHKLWEVLYVQCNTTGAHTTRLLASSHLFPRSTKGKSSGRSGAACEQHTQECQCNLEGKIYNHRMCPSLQNYAHHLEMHVRDLTQLRTRLGLSLRIMPCMILAYPVVNVNQRNRRGWREGKCQWEECCLKCSLWATRQERVLRDQLPAPLAFRSSPRSQCCSWG